MSIKRIDDWSLGMNNNAQPDKLPEAHVRSLVNLDATASGTLEKRAGYELVMQVSNIRAAGSVGNYLIIIADNVLSYSQASDSHAVLISAVGYGAVSVVNHAGYLFFMVGDAGYKTDGVEVWPWSVVEPLPSISFSSGSLSGLVKVVVTAEHGGMESGFDPFLVNLENQSLTVTCSDSRSLNLYVSPPNHETLYFQTKITNGSASIDNVNAGERRFDLAGLKPFPACDILASYNSLIIGVKGRFLFMSTPMMPHLHDPVSGFLQYESDVTEVCCVDGGVFVGTEHKTYFVTGLEVAAELSQREVSSIGIIKGTRVSLNENAVAWFTKYGQAVGLGDGSVSMLNDGKFSPSTAAVGAAVLSEHNGNKVAVTTMRGSVEQSGLGIGFYSELEV